MHDWSLNDENAEYLCMCAAGCHKNYSKESEMKEQFILYTVFDNVIGGDIQSRVLMQYCMWGHFRP